MRIAHNSVHLLLVTGFFVDKETSPLRLSVPLLSVPGQLSHLGCWVCARTTASEFGESIRVWLLHRSVCGKITLKRRFIKFRDDYILDCWKLFCDKGTITSQVNVYFYIQLYDAINTWGPRKKVCIFVGRVYLTTKQGWGATSRLEDT